MSSAGAVLRARAYLLRVAEPPAPALLRLIAAVGPVEAATRVRAGAVAQSVARETAARRAVERVDDDLAAAHACGARLLTPEDPAWPHWAFTALENAAHGPPAADPADGVADGDRPSGGPGSGGVAGRGLNGDGVDEAAGWGRRGLRVRCGGRGPTCCGWPSRPRPPWPG